MATNKGGNAVKTPPLELMTRKEAADMLRQTPKTLANWHSLGRGPRCTIVGRAAVYTRADVEAYFGMLYQAAA